MTEGPTPPLSPPIAAALEELIGYNWNDELDDFFAGERQEGAPTSEEVADGGHIFLTMVRLDQWSRGNDWSDEAVTRVLQAIYQETQEQAQIRGGETDEDEEQ